MPKVQRHSNTRTYIEEFQWFIYILYLLTLSNYLLPFCIAVPVMIATSPESATQLVNVTLPPAIRGALTPSLYHMKVRGSVPLAAQVKVTLSPTS